MSEVEQLEEQLKIARAKERLSEIEETGLQEFKKSVAEASSLDELRKVAGNFVSRLNNINMILKPKETPKGNRGRKPKSD